MSEIRTKPSTDKYRKGFERTFRKPKIKKGDVLIPTVLQEPITHIYCNNDPNFGR